MMTKEIGHESSAQTCALVTALHWRSTYWYLISIGTGVVFERTPDDRDLGRSGLALDIG
ncbi:MAG: hypothetical protein R2867_10225 [Caldilineaceae bacterium]